MWFQEEFWGLDMLGGEGLEGVTLLARGGWESEIIAKEGGARYFRHELPKETITCLYRESEYLSSIYVRDIL